MKKSNIETLPHVLAIDGPTKSGKTTVMNILAEMLPDYHLLDSGMLYRGLGYIANAYGIFENHIALKKLAENLPISFRKGEAFLWENTKATLILQGEETAILASKVAQVPEARRGLMNYLLTCRKEPGLIAIGRDMSWIFPDTPFKYYLNPSIKKRAEWCCLKVNEDYLATYQKINERDDNDRNRTISPLQIHQDALIIDSSDMSAQQTAELILRDYIDRK